MTSILLACMICLFIIQCVLVYTNYRATKRADKAQSERDSYVTISASYERQCKELLTDLVQARTQLKEKMLQIRAEQDKSMIFDDVRVNNWVHNISNKYN